MYEPKASHPRRATPAANLGALTLVATLGVALLSGLLPSLQVIRRAHAEAAKPQLHVFLPLDAKSSAVEKVLRERLPELNVTVFGRFRDFEDALSSRNADVLLTIPPILEQYGKKVTLEGRRGGKSTEPYVLASIAQPLSGSLAGKTIGVVDLLGRDGTQKFVTGLLKASDLKIKRVAKIEDLLPLLEFSAADGIVLPQFTMKRLLERTRLSIKSQELPNAVGLPVVAVLNPAVRELVVNCFQKMDGTTKSLLGIESWSAR
jgi:hypothetical protein